MLSSFCSHSQNGWKNGTIKDYQNLILEVENKFPKDESYSFDCDYLFFTDPAIETPELEMKSSLICNKKKELFMTQFGRSMYQNQLIKITIDSTDNKIILSDPELVLFNRNTTEGFKDIIKSDCKVKINNSGSIKKYYFEFTKNPKYLAAELWITPQKMIRKYILYTASEILDETAEESRLIQPRLEVIFKNHHFGKSVDLSKMPKAEDFIQVIAGEFMPTTRYQNYTLIDLRNSND